MKSQQRPTDILTTGQGRGVFRPLAPRPEELESLYARATVSVSTVRRVKRGEKIGKEALHRIVASVKA